MGLKPQDVVVLLKIALSEQGRWSFNSLAHELVMSPSEVHAAAKRAIQAGLLSESTRQPNRSALLELIVHGIKYVFAPERGGITRGLPTGYAAPPLNKKIAQSDELPPVWPDAEGTVRGEALMPLYRSVPAAARKDPKLYECLALVDAVRSGRARERKLAESMLTSILSA